MPDVLIAGAGPTGLMTALGLQRANLDVLIPEHDAHPIQCPRPTAPIRRNPDRPQSAQRDDDIASYLPDGDIASLRRFYAGREVYASGLFSRNYWLDDAMGEMIFMLDFSHSTSSKTAAAASSAADGIGCAAYGQALTMRN